MYAQNTQTKTQQNKNNTNDPIFILHTETIFNMSQKPKLQEQS